MSFFLIPAVLFSPFCTVGILLTCRSVFFSLFALQFFVCCFRLTLFNFNQFLYSRHKL